LGEFDVRTAAPDHLILFLVEGVALILLGLLAIVIPSIDSANVTVVLGWLFLVSGAVGLVTTYRARQAPGFWWSLVSALLAIVVGVVLIANKSHDLNGGLMGWPFEKTGPLRPILALFFRSSGYLFLDDGPAGGDQHDHRRLRSDRDGIACWRRTWRFECNSAA